MNMCGKYELAEKDLTMRYKDTIEDLLYLSLMEQSFKKRRDIVRKKLLNMMGKNGVHMIDCSKTYECRIRVAEQEDGRIRFDTASFKRDHPSLYKRYAIVTPSDPYLMVNYKKRRSQKVEDMLLKKGVEKYSKDKEFLELDAVVDNESFAEEQGEFELGAEYLIYSDTYRIKGKGTLLKILPANEELSDENVKECFPFAESTFSIQTLKGAIPFTRLVFDAVYVENGVEKEDKNMILPNNPEYFLFKKVGE